VTPATVSNRSQAERVAFWLGLVVIFICAAIVLRLEGRLWICACGSVKFWIGNTCSSETSQHFLDPYAFTHVLHGFAFFWLIGLVIPRLKSHWQLLLAIALEAAWEIFENTNFVIERYRTATAALGLHGGYRDQFDRRHRVLLGWISNRKMAGLPPRDHCVRGSRTGADSVDQG
jgi:hypothetical protein